MEKTWLDEVTRQTASNMLKDVNYKMLGYHGEILEEDKMKKYHDRFLVEEMNPNSFVENQVKKGSYLLSRLIYKHLICVFYKSCFFLPLRIFAGQAAKSNQLVQGSQGSGDKKGPESQIL